MRPQPSRIDDLLDAHLRGRPGAGDRLIAALQPTLIQASHRILGASDPDAEDIVQDALIAILAYCEERGGFTGNLEAFSYQVVRNRCLDLVRQRRRRRRREFAESDWRRLEPDPLDGVIRQEERKLLETAFAQLGEACRKLLSQNYLKGISIRRIREQLGRSNVQKVYYDRRCCLKKLGQILRVLDRDVD